jgi:hypothetical protein
MAIPIAAVIAVGPHKTEKQQIAALPGGNAIAFVTHAECNSAAEGIAKSSGGKVKPDCRPLQIISKRAESF